MKGIIRILKRQTTFWIYKDIFKSLVGLKLRKSLKKLRFLFWFQLWHRTDILDGTPCLAWRFHIWVWNGIYTVLKAECPSCLWKLLTRQYCTRRLFLLAPNVGESLPLNQTESLFLLGFSFLGDGTCHIILELACLPASFPNQTTVKFYYCAASQTKSISSRLSL